ncbi:hypothetical protein CDD82_4308 [Ophiocordyceps australis]|uniref:Aminotransferase class I/classII large domain-containing protein n=1 Tax=Ophiocordyceps australis TaxID=1399860 RepID=A0A2C5Z7Q5_9HYPO|nr:hypothetical protein CDD82_4308 [Ophiocordyceps australis]
MWANILEDKEFLADFIAKNRQVLAKHCTILRVFLDRHGIPYYTNVYAGVFVWVDLRRYLYGESFGTVNSPETTSSTTNIHQDREMMFFKYCLASGIAISPGSSFSTEELGWFRLSFAVEEQALHIGLERLLQCLERFKIEY